jgi:CheY-like chemotaxis protein/drug/metabolite transporter (DMT)-like permease
MDHSLAHSIPAKGRILIVDDGRTNRLKMTMSAKALGHEAVAVEDGAKALAKLAIDEFDVVLLDIVMPEIDGFEVLRQIGKDDNLRHIPVIVVSALEDMEDIVKAIKLGAVDFLPKNFDVVLLEARINSCLEKKKRRDQEIRTLSEVRRLTDAASELDSVDFNPTQSGVQDIAMRSDPLGQLALVLLNKSIEVYNRQLSQRQQIKTLIGCFMLLFVGACFGLNIALAKLMIPSGTNPLGLAFYTLGIGAVITTLYALTKKSRWPTLSWYSLRYYGAWALFAPLLPQLLLFWVAGKLPAVLVAIIMTMEAFIVFFIAVFMGLEKFNSRRFVGLALGAGGILIILLPAIESGGGIDSNFLWLLAAISIPICFALRNILIALGKTSDVDPVAAVATVYSIATLMMFGIALTTDSLVSFRYPFNQIEWFMIAFAFIEAAGVIVFVSLVQSAGSIFASQKAYTVAIAGIIWSVILLGEAITAFNVAALLLAITGLYFVAQKAKREELLRQYIDRPKS